MTVIDNPTPVSLLAMKEDAYCWAGGPTPVSLLAMKEDAYCWADGPTGVGYCKPSERPESRSRDLAMEGYENGHPRIVYA